MAAIERINDQNDDIRAALLALNNEHEKETSFLTPATWAHLISEAYDATCIGSQGFLVTFDQNADYDSPNFVWFQQRYQRFVYVDRIVISASARGRGLARQLYEGLFKVARENEIERIVCEINFDPPNPGSDAFHAKMGFLEVGRATLKNRAKSVRYLCRDL